MFGTILEFDYVFQITAYGEREMNEFLNKFEQFKEHHPFSVSYAGMPPSVLNMNPSARVIFFKHRDGLINTTTGLKSYLQDIIYECGIEKPVHLLNS